MDRIINIPANELYNSALIYKSENDYNNYLNKHGLMIELTEIHN